MVDTHRLEGEYTCKKRKHAIPQTSDFSKRIAIWLDQKLKYNELTNMKLLLLL